MDCPPPNYQCVYLYYSVDHTGSNFSELAVRCESKISKPVLRNYIKRCHNGQKKGTTETQRSRVVWDRKRLILARRSKRPCLEQVVFIRYYEDESSFHPQKKSEWNQVEPRLWWPLNSDVRTALKEDTTTGRTTSVFSPESVQTPSVWLLLCPLGENKGNTLWPFCPLFFISVRKKPNPME